MISVGGEHSRNFRFTDVPAHELQRLILRRPIFAARPGPVLMGFDAPRSQIASMETNFRNSPSHPLSVNSEILCLCLQSFTVPMQTDETCFFYAGRNSEIF